MASLEHTTVLRLAAGDDQLARVRVYRPDPGRPLMLVVDVAGLSIINTPDSTPADVAGVLRGIANSIDRAVGEQTTEEP